MLIVRLSIYFSILNESIFGQPSIESRIIGGEVVTVRSNLMPYQASIQIIYRHVCGGAIIADTWVGKP